MSEDNPELRARVREERRRRGWTQRELAERADVSTRTIQMFETGQASPQAGTLQAILNAIEISPEHAWVVELELVMRWSAPTAGDCMEQIGNKIRELESAGTIVGMRVRRAS